MGTYRNHRYPFLTLVPVVCMLTVIADNDNQEKILLTKSTLAGLNALGYHTAFASVRKPYTRLRLDSGEALAAVDTLDSSLQRFVSAIINARFLHVGHCSFYLVVLATTACTSQY